MPDGWALVLTWLANLFRDAAEWLDPDPWMTGKIIRTADDYGDYLPRCTACGYPRGTLRHGLRCMSGGCFDPDAMQDGRTDDPRRRARPSP
jgi:hypothetical protein